MATEPKGIDVSNTPSLPPACLKESTVPMADRDDEGEIPYPYEQRTVPPWAFMNAPMDVLTGYLGSRLPTSDANMLVKGFVPHSGPSKNPPVTGTPCWFGALSARKKRGLTDTMPTAPLESAFWTAVATSVGLVWSSRTTPVILWPLTPPSAFCIAMRELKPTAAWLNSEDPSPVSEVIMTTVNGAPDVAAPAVPPARLVMPAAAVIANAASPDRTTRVLEVPLIARTSSPQEPPDPRQSPIGLHATERQRGSGVRDLG